MGLDADGLYIATENFDAAGLLVDRSVYSIPKADLLAGVPSIANLTRREDLASIGTLQGVIDFGASDGRAPLFAAQTGGGDVIVRRNLTGTGGAGANLSGTTDIDVDPYTPAPDGEQQGFSQDLDNRPGDPAFTSHAVEIGDDVWMVHSVADATTGRSAIRWYQIDEPTNTVVQSGTITDPARDFLYPSIAVNNNGDVVIGMTGTGGAQRPSAMAVVGTTIGGTTFFRPPTLLQAGVGPYQNLDANARNRWGDYSATWVDPVNADRFWTFQERSAGVNNWGTQITEVILPGATNNVTVPVFQNNNIVNGGVILP
jgi:hypothetical protein